MARAEGAVSNAWHSSDAMVVPATMTAMRLKGPGHALEPDVVAVPQPSPSEVLLEVLACGVCRTDLHVLDGELPDLRYPVTPGHEIVGRVVAVGSAVTNVALGERVGVPWLARTCGECEPCRLGLENLCERAEFTGYTVPGGYAEFVAADARYCLEIPERYTDAAAAPLLCAGLIGYRAYRAAGDAHRLGLYGFGAAAHLLAQVARFEQRDVYGFTRPGDRASQAFARRLGAVWVGGSDELPEEPLDAAIIFAAVGSLVPAALAAVRPGGRVVCAGIHMSDIPSFPYRLLWGERSVVSVANLTRADGRDFMRSAARLQLTPSIEIAPLTAANEALARLKAGKLEGAAVLVPERGGG
jgi:alcohol dehydrogenase, propanol-preferring